MLVQKCSLLMKDEPKIDFIEYAQSVLRLMPSVSVYEYRVSACIYKYYCTANLLWANNNYVTHPAGCFKA